MHCVICVIYICINLITVQQLIRIKSPAVCAFPHHSHIYRGRGALGRRQGWSALDLTDPFLHTPLKRTKLYIHQHLPQHTPSPLTLTAQDPTSSVSRPGQQVPLQRWRLQASDMELNPPLTGNTSLRSNRRSPSASWQHAPTLPSPPGTLSDF